ncbi:hypothetical protein SAMN06269117_10958 [Balnearium lithotrophicum]|uniref:DUF374 domain-containing protein n=1 Tax=Balnearium lithotrophicum TaxID=223788 RepID=A0A521C3G6_9BACT|nr:lysophospholipid acyltransferase family protein [Balnearium lithotrophicum]SMO54026.1 hypothetical protein SAMN06269117_10958 [Balnearium lithotrophicum]
MRLSNPEFLFRVSSLWVRTLRIEKIFLSEPKFPSIVAFWHGRMFLLPFALKEYSDKVAILISRHRDGELISNIVGKMGFKTIRGSTGVGKGGERAFLRMVDWLEKGGVVAITPDGPRGPVEVVKRGIAKLSMKTGVPIYPLTFSSSRKIHLNSWDRFLIPLPFSRCKVVLGKPILPEKFKDEESLRKEVELKLRSLIRKVDRGEL